MSYIILISICLVRIGQRAVYKSQHVAQSKFDGLW